MTEHDYANPPSALGTICILLTEFLWDSKRSVPQFKMGLQWVRC
eukprot:CAMPEP_0194396236 /NCGR_PEP_ID=MMETSP0174-20130528/124871_1 /TAXON_ID=216777 /ORGANISM="Proboscia alata, Strain PI-D3" /LENGTH=43 /DNA_ID= /DNA_START= /DNA_END= /DNA_ORIENTATION=